MKNSFCSGSSEYLERLDGKFRDGIFFHVTIFNNNSHSVPVGHKQEKIVRASSVDFPV